MFLFNSAIFGVSKFCRHTQNRVQKVSEHFGRKEEKRQKHFGLFFFFFSSVRKYCENSIYNFNQMIMDKKKVSRNYISNV